MTPEATLLDIQPHDSIYEIAREFQKLNPTVRVFPLEPNKKEPKKGIRWTDDSKKIRDFNWEGATGYGVVPIGMTGIDLDGYGAAKAFESKVSEFGDAPDTLIVRTPNGVHMYFTGETEHRNGWMKNIDIRSGSSGYLVGPGSIVKGAQYRVVSDVAAAQIPSQYRDLILSGTHGQQEAREAIDALERTQNTFQDVANAIGYNNTLLSLKGKLIRIGIDEPTTNQMVIAANNNLENPYPLDDLKHTVLANKDYEQFGYELSDVDKSSITGGRLTTREDRLKRPPPTWLVDQCIPSQGVGQVVAASGTGKSFAMIDLGLSISSGKASWLDRDITLEDNKDVVIFINSEGNMGFQRRLDAWNVKEGGVFDEKLYDLNAEEFSIDISTEDGLMSLEADIISADIKGKVAMVIADTQGQLFATADENSNSEFNQAIKRIKQFTHKHKCAFILVHHTGHDATRGRGASAQRQAMDFQFSIANGVIDLTKSKESEAALNKAFRLSEIKGTDSVAFDTSQANVKDVVQSPDFLPSPQRFTGSALENAVRDRVARGRSYVSIAIELNISAEQVKEIVG